SVATSSDGKAHVVWEEGTTIAYRFKNVSINMWSTIETVSTEVPVQSDRPAICIDSARNAHVVWTSTDGKLNYRMRNATTGLWATTLQIGDVNSDSKVEVETDGVRKISVAWMYMGWIYHRAKIIATSTWSANITLNPYGGSYEVAMHVSTNGDAVVAWIDPYDYGFDSNGHPDAKFKVFTNASGTWSTLVLDASLQSTMAVTTVDVTINGSLANSAVFVWSGDQQTIETWWQYGGSGSNGVTLSSNSPPSAKPRITIDGAGQYYVTWMEGSTAEVFFRCDVDSQTIDYPITLQTISPSHNTDGIITLEWSPIAGFVRYHVFRSSSPFFSVGGMNPITTVSINTTTDILSPAQQGSYYYAVLADDGYYNSSLSNRESVLFAYPLATPTLSDIVPSTDDDGIITLSWGAITNATTYYVYRSDTNFTSTGELLPVNVTSDNSVIDTLGSSGVYYYAIVAGNAFINSTQSGTKAVTIVLPLAAPTLSATWGWASGAFSINVSWTPETEAAWYLVYRSASPITSLGSLSPVANVTGTTTAWIDSLTTEGTYYYKVVAANNFTTSVASNEASVDLAIPSTPGISADQGWFLLLIAAFACVGVVLNKERRISV
nr:hypothetical protein [Candidatus Sigynarchaeota archaeon]